VTKGDFRKKIATSLAFIAALCIISAFFKA
jgi:hypothetical protein